MIELTRSHETHPHWNVKILGIGGAGTHAVDRLNQDGLAGVEMAVANTDARALAAAYTVDKIVLGQKLTRGMGAGGDPELGRSAADESIQTVGAKLADASLVVLLVGLGGGTGSGAAPRVAQAARAQGSHVAVFATLPFSFEGRRRREQALEALDALREQADLVVCFENDRMSDVADPSAGIEDAFQAVDSLLAQSVKAICSMTRQRNVMHSGIDEIASTVAGARSTALFGHGAADGEERARAAVSRAFSSPLLDAAGALGSAHRLWVYVTGGPDLRWTEVQQIMEEITARFDQEVGIYFGAAVDPEWNGAVSVTLLAGVPDSSNPGVEISKLARQSAPAVAPRIPTGERHQDYFQQAQPHREAVVVPQQGGSSSGSWHEDPAHYEPAGAAENVLFAPEPEPEPQWQSIFNRSRQEAPETESKYSEPAQDSPSFTSFAAEEPPQHDSEPLYSEPEPFDSAPAAPYHAEPEPADWLPDIPPPQPPQPVSARSMPTPPFESSKERRREAAQQPQPPHASAHFSEPARGYSSPAEEPLQPHAPVEIRELIPDHAPAHQEEPLQREAVNRRNKDTVQEQMRFEPVNRGRFEKTDPTIVDGEDLDVPTFMRQRLPLE